MTPVEIASSIVGIIIGAVTPLVLGYWRWIDKREVRQFQQQQAAREASWKQEDVEHKHRMELAALTAARAASESVKEVRASKVERSEQVGELKQMIEDNTAISSRAFDAANHVNEKIASLGVEIAKKTATQKLT